MAARQKPTETGAGKTPPVSVAQNKKKMTQRELRREQRRQDDIEEAKELIAAHKRKLKDNGLKCEKKELAALLLARGFNSTLVAEVLKVSRTTLYRWKEDTDYLVLVDELTKDHDLSIRGWRLRFAKRALRDTVARREQADLPLSDKDPLDWLKFAREETEGMRIFTDEQLELIANALAGYKTTDEERSEAVGRTGTGETGSAGD